MTAHKWTEAERCHVASLLKSGRSLGRISRLMGMTRSQVIGRVYRDGELHDMHEGATAMARLTAKIERENRMRKKPFTPPLAAPAGTVAVVPIVAAAPIQPKMSWGEGKPLVALGRFECRFALREDEHVVGGHIFCARPVEHAEASYCHRHNRIAHGYP